MLQWTRAVTPIQILNHVCLVRLITQSELNDLASDLGLSEMKAELLGTRLQGWRLSNQIKCNKSRITKISVF